MLPRADGPREDFMAAPILHTSSNHVLVPCEFRHTGPGVSEAELLECFYRVGDDKVQDGVAPCGPSSGPLRRRAGRSSPDIVSKFEPTILCDIRSWDYTTLTPCRKQTRLWTNMRWRPRRGLCRPGSRCEALSIPD